MHLHGVLMTFFSGFKPDAKIMGPEPCQNQPDARNISPIPVQFWHIMACNYLLNLRHHRLVYISSAAADGSSPSPDHHDHLSRLPWIFLGAPLWQYVKISSWCIYPAHSHMAKVIVICIHLLDTYETIIHVFRSNQFNTNGCWCPAPHIATTTAAMLLTVLGGADKSIDRLPWITRYCGCEKTALACFSENRASYQHIKIILDIKKKQWFHERLFHEFLCLQRISILKQVSGFSVIFCNLVRYKQKNSLPSSMIY